MKKSALLAATLLAAPALAGVPETMEATRIPAYRLIRPGLAAAGQPSPETLAQLGALGFRTVVNLRTEREGAAEEKAVVESQGLRYVWVPVTPDTFSLADVEAVERVLDDAAAAPILLHCASANRVGAVWAVVQARKGNVLDEALAAGREAGLHNPQMEAIVRRVLEGPAAAAPPPVKP
jgi:uncharacterized protein (TIGR01244 family)